MRYLYGSDRPKNLPPNRPAINPSPTHSTSLRRDLSERSQKQARDQALPHEITPGPCPAVLFSEDPAGHHGNFFALSYRAIKQRPEWARRLAKAHTASRRALLSDGQQSRRPRRSELDSSNSSDALLMNIFCHPETLATRGVRLLLGIDPAAQPIFGFKPRIPLRPAGRSVRTDCTEIDLKLGDLLIEAKLTENGFQTAPRRLIDRYRDLEEVFDLATLAPADPDPNEPDSAHPDPNDDPNDDPNPHPTHLRYVDLDTPDDLTHRRPPKIHSYQLIRGVLAAYADPATRFCVLCDARRPDLIATWHRVLTTVKIYDLRSRLLLLTWQELAATLPPNLQAFLALKYGILSEHQPQSERPKRSF